MSKTPIEVMRLNATLADIVYQPSTKKQMAALNKLYPDRFESLPESNKNNLVVRDKTTGKIHVSIAGTDIGNTKGQRLADLGTDALVTFGLQKLSSRYKQSDKTVKNVVDKYPDTEVILASHSVGGDRKSTRLNSSH